MKILPCGLKQWPVSNPFLLCEQRLLLPHPQLFQLGVGIADNALDSPVLVAMGGSLETAQPSRLSCRHRCDADTALVWIRVAARSSRRITAEDLSDESCRATPCALHRANYRQ